MTTFDSRSCDHIRIKDIESVSTRLVLRLASIGIHTVGELLLHYRDMSSNSLLKMKIRGLGKKSLAEMDQLLERINISEEVTLLPYSKAIQNDPILEWMQTVPLDEKDFIYIPNIPLVQLRAYYDGLENLVALNIHTTAELFSFCCKQGIADWYKINKFASTSACNIMNLLSIMWNREQWRGLLGMMIDGQSVTPAIALVERPSDGMFINMDEHELNEAVDILQQQFIERVSQLSVRSQNFIKTEMPCFGDVIVNTMFYSKHCMHWKNCGVVTWKEVLAFAARFRKDLKEIRTSSLKTLKVVNMLNALSCTYANDDIVYFVDFYNIHGHLPMFYILTYNLLQSDGLFEKLYRVVYGILCTPTQLRDLAKTYHKSYEACRQLIAASDLYDKHRMKTDALINLTKWESYHIEDNLFLTSKSCLYERVKKQERLTDLSFIGFGYLCKLLVPLRYIAIKNNHYFVAKKLLDCFDLHRALSDIDAIISKKVVFHDVEISITTFMRSYWLGSQLVAAEEVAKMLCLMISENYEVSIGEGFIIRLLQNAINVTSELYNILYAEGAPMSIDDIFKQFKSKYPNHKYDEPDQIRWSLLKNSRICAIGKTSRYALKEWDVCTGTIRDLIQEALKKSSRPLTAKELCECIKEYYDTTPRNIRSSVLCDKSGKFMLFKGGYIGMSEVLYPSVMDCIQE